MIHDEDNIDLLEDFDGAPFPDDVQYAHAMVVGELTERIARAKSALAFFGYQADPIIRLLEGEDGQGTHPV